MQLLVKVANKLLFCFTSKVTSDRNTQRRHDATDGKHRWSEPEEVLVNLRKLNYVCVTRSCLSLVVQINQLQGVKLLPLITNIFIITSTGS